MSDIIALIGVVIVTYVIAYRDGAQRQRWNGLRRTTAIVPAAPTRAEATNRSNCGRIPGADTPGAYRSTEFDAERRALLTAYGINPDHCIRSHVFRPTLQSETLRTTFDGDTFILKELHVITLDEYHRMTGMPFQRNGDATADPSPVHPPLPCEHA